MQDRAAMEARVSLDMRARELDYRDNAECSIFALRFNYSGTIEEKRRDAGPRGNPKGVRKPPLCRF